MKFKDSNNNEGHAMAACIHGLKWRFLLFLGMVFCLAAPAVAADASADNASLLHAIHSPILLKGDAHTAYRDPLLFHHGNTFYLFYSYVREDESAHLIYWYVGTSTSHDLQHWSSSRGC